MGSAEQREPTLTPPSISMRQALSAFTSGWSTVKRSGEQVEIKRVTEIQMYFFSGDEVTLSAVKITAAQ